jgi:hypothetical protein
MRTATLLENVCARASKEDERRLCPSLLFCSQTACSRQAGEGSSHDERRIHKAHGPGRTRPFASGAGSHRGGWGRDTILRAINDVLRQRPGRHLGTLSDESRRSFVRERGTLSTFPFSSDEIHDTRTQYCSWSETR